jgi:immune inhibitor A
LIDDVRIPELGYEDDFEPGPGGWQAEGFVYSDNQVSQRYLVQLVTLGEQARVLRVPLDEVQRGRVELRGLGNTDAPPTERVDSAVLVISALAPVTTEIAPYEYVVRRLGE